MVEKRREGVCCSIAKLAGCLGVAYHDSAHHLTWIGLAWLHLVVRKGSIASMYERLVQNQNQKL